MRKIFIFIVTVLVAVALIIITDTIISKKDSFPVVTIGHAVCDENAGLHGGKAGDQNENEVFMRSWYSGWDVVIRAKDSEKAEKTAQAMEEACANDNIGYDQYERTTLYKQAKKSAWRIADITQPCETDCSALVAVCVTSAGINIDKNVFTGNLESALMNTGEFEEFKDENYTQSTELLQRGDILLKKGHVAIVTDVKTND